MDLIERTERDLPAFADPAYLESIGFHDFGIAAPGGYVHYINNAWIDDDHVLDPTHPESLLFQRVWDPDTGQSQLVLKAAMFFMPTGTTMDTIPADLAWIPGWHVHPDVCVTDDVTFAGLANMDGTCSQGHPQLGPPMTHVWIADNACGHRFGMVGVGGLMCDMHMHMPDDPHPEPTLPPGPSTSTPLPPTTTPATSTTTSTSTVPASTTRNLTAQVAQPVAARPAYTG